MNQKLLRISMLCAISSILIGNRLPADQKPMPKKEQGAVVESTRQSCPLPAANFCSVNANCGNFGTLIATGNAIFEGIVDITNTTPTTSCDSGALVVAGGVGIGGDLNVCGHATFGGARSVGLLSQELRAVPCTGPTLEVEVLGDEGISGDLFVCGNEIVGGNLTVNGTLTASGGISVTGPLNITNTTQSTSCTGGALVVAGGVGIGGNLNVCGNTTLNNLTVDGNITPVNGTITIGSPQFPTIQSAFDFLRGKVVGNVLIDLVAPASGVKVYNETLSLNGVISNASQGFAMPQNQYPLRTFAGLTVVQPGLSIRGDSRYAAGMTYISGAQLNYLNQLNVASTGYVAKLGTPYGIVSLTNPAAGEIQVTITAAPTTNPDFGGAVVLEQPDFVAAGVVAGDQILIRDSAGAYHQLTVTGIVGPNNIISYSGTNVAALGLGAELVLLPRVQIVNTTANPAGAGFYLGTGVTVQGVWFQNPLTGDVIQVGENGFLKLQQSFVDYNGVAGGGVGIVVLFNGTVGTEISGVVMHNSITCRHVGPFGLFVVDHGAVDSGDWVATDGSAAGAFIDEATSSAFLNSYNGVGSVANLRLGNGASANVANLIGSYQGAGAASIGIRLTVGCNLSIIDDNIQVNGAAQGVLLANGSNFGVGTTSLYTPIGSQILNCTTAGMVLDAGSAFNYQNGGSTLLIDNTPVGVEGRDGARFLIQTGISFGAGVPLHRVFDATSVYGALGSVETPNNVLTISASRALDSAIKTQLVTGAGTNVTLNPTLVTGGIPLYQGSRYNLKAINNGGNPFTLTLTPPAVFIGQGTPSGTNHIITVNSVSPFDGAGVDFTVINGTTVMINDLLNGIVS